jgi:hypothetical protein
MVCTPSLSQRTFSTSGLDRKSMTDRAGGGSDGGSVPSQPSSGADLVPARGRRREKTVEPGPHFLFRLRPSRC